MKKFVAIIYTASLEEEEEAWVFKYFTAATLPRVFKKNCFIWKESFWYYLPVYLSATAVSENAIYERPQKISKWVEYGLFLFFKIQ